jgi:hypothetical protein
MNSRILAATAACIAMALTAGAASAQTYVFDFSNLDPQDAYGPIVGSGTLQTAGGTLPSAVTGISGLVAGGTAGDNGAITGLSNFALASNVLYPGPSVRLEGIAFDVGSTAYDILSIGGADYLVSSLPGSGWTPISLSIAAVPEPATWAMLILGVAMIGFAARRRNEATALAA